MMKYAWNVILLLFAPLLFAQTQDSVLSDYARQISEVKTLTSHFTEQKHLSLLSAPIESAGELAFDKAKQTLLWQYKTPFQNGFIIEKENVYRVDGNTKTRVKDTMGKMMAAQLVVWLTLDFNSLKQTYEIALRGREITFTPRAKTHKVVKQITVSLDEKNPQIVTQVKLEEPGGDFIVWQFTDTRINPPAQETL